MSSLTLCCLFQLLASVGKRETEWLGRSVEALLGGPGPRDGMRLTPALICLQAYVLSPLLNGCNMGDSINRLCKSSCNTHNSWADSSPCCPRNPGATLLHMGSLSILERKIILLLEIDVTLTTCLFALPRVKAVTNY